MRHRAFTSSLVVLGAVLALTPAAVAAPAAPPAASGVAAAAPVATPATARVAGPVPLPTVQVDGVVWAQVAVGHVVYAAGRFSAARPAGAAPGTQETPRGNILAYDIRTGELIRSFDHTLNAQALGISASSDGKVVYVGGEFTTVDGQSRTRIAAFSVATGKLLPFAPDVNSTVQTIAATATTVYFGGSFNTVDGHPRGRLAATTRAGALLDWAPRATGIVRGVIAVPRYHRVYLAGSFSSVNGQLTYGVSAVDDLTGASIPVPVSSQILATYRDTTAAGVYSLRTDGARIYGAGYNAFSWRSRSSRAPSRSTPRPGWCSG